MLDVTAIGALVAGLLSFLSPCILPIVPFYLSYLAGAGANRIAAEEEIDARLRSRAILLASLFALGIITVFVGLGAAATVFGELVRDHFDLLRWGAAAIIVAMGLHFLGIVRIGLLYRQISVGGGTQGNLGLAVAYLVGVAFAFGWTPCVGPVLASILFLAAGQDSALHGAALLFVYGAGMTVPFILAAAFISPFMRWAARFRRHMPTVEKLVGGLLVLFGVLIATESFGIIAQWMLEVAPWFGAIG